MNSATGVRAGETGITSGPTQSQSELVRTTITAVLLALLVTWMFTAWWSAPRPADVAELDRALAAGEVTGFVRASGLEREGTFWSGGVSPAYDSGGTMIVWQTASGRSSYDWLDDAAPGPPPGPFEADQRRATPETDAVERRVRAAGIYHVYDQGATPKLGLFLVLGCLLVLIGGPDPRRGTRWFWFWVGGLPGGLGVLAWLVLERIRPPPPVLVVEGDRDRRWHGYAGLGCLLLGGILASFAVYWLRETFGFGLIPG